MTFRDKVVVVTGGAQGIGKCCAECFEREGAHVHVIDVQHGPWFVGNLADKSVLERFAAEVIAKSGHVDVLVNNAMPLFKGIDECTYEEFVYAQAVGVIAP
ncbi:MAG: SDR family NAD(P)-dependent oxidoreductase, partial [Victivallales bacterium]|nr:SDR family NAD(P)-dependent oxidoreductase [Victivallales bacterium]